MNSDNILQVHDIRQIRHWTLSMVFAGGQHTTGRQPWSQDIRTSEKDQFFPLYTALRPLSLAASWLDANGLCALWALPFPSLSYSPVPCSPLRNLGISPGPYFFSPAVCANDLVTSRWVMFNAASFKRILFSSFLCDGQSLCSEQQQRSYHSISSSLTTNRKWSLIFWSAPPIRWAHISAIYATTSLGAFQISFPFCSSQENWRVVAPPVFFTRNNICLQGFVYSWVNMGK